MPALFPGQDNSSVEMHMKRWMPMNSGLFRMATFMGTGVSLECPYTSPPIERNRRLLHVTKMNDIRIINLQAHRLETINGNRIMTAMHINNDKLIRLSQHMKWPLMGRLQRATMGINTYKHKASSTKTRNLRCCRQRMMVHGRWQRTKGWVAGKELTQQLREMMAHKNCRGGVQVLFGRAAEAQARAPMVSW